MTMLPLRKKCPKCHKKYAWNPDVGHFDCPYCHGLGKPGDGILESIFGKKKVSHDDENYCEVEGSETKNLN